MTAYPAVFYAQDSRFSLIEHARGSQICIAFRSCHDNSERLRGLITAGVWCTYEDTERQYVQSRGGAEAWRGKQRATNRGIGVLQMPARTAFTWRAPSSPHLACGLNGSLFLHFCCFLATAQAGCLVGVLGESEPCGTLRRCVLSADAMRIDKHTDLGIGSGKGSVFLSVMGCFERPVFPGLERQLWMVSYG